MYKKISDYGIIGNFHTVALVGCDGSIDWLCLPHMDSPSIFAALLDHHRGGRFALGPAGDYDSTAAYLPETNVLVTTFRTRSAIIKLTDFMPVNRAMEQQETPYSHELYRLMEVTTGEAELGAEFLPRFDYGRCETSLAGSGARVTASCGDESVTLCCSRGGLSVNEGKASGRWRLAAGESVEFLLQYGADAPPCYDGERARHCLHETRSYWSRWLNDTPGPEPGPGPFRGMINRSALLLKLLEYTPTGAIAAAATTSLPEGIGGVRNWDYRYSWVRDSALTIEALYRLGFHSEMVSYFRWLEGVIRSHGLDLQVLYGLRGETNLTETNLTHLDGYKGSRPVRIGNLAEKQLQLDIYGEIMDAALRLSRYAGSLNADLWPNLRGICDLAAKRWRQKDSGMWEMRGGPFHFVFSKVMCWVALDRGLAIARSHGFTCDGERWEREMDAIRTEVFTRGWSERKRSFVQDFEGEDLDACSLLMPVYGFIPFEDPRMVSTVEAIRRELERDGFVRRYRMDDGLPGEEGAFLVCTFWLVDNLIGQGNLYEAEVLLLRAERCANHLGIFSEEYDPLWHESLGNVPQAFTHIGYINSVMTLIRSKAIRSFRHAPDSAAMPDDDRQERKQPHEDQRQDERP